MINKKDTQIILIVLSTAILIGLVIIFFDKKLKTIDRPASVAPIETDRK
jgi:hypothetical protein